MVEILRPSLVQVTDTAYKPAVLIGGNTALSDDSDATYADQWLSFRGGAGDGPTLRATFDPAGSVTPFADFFRFRFEVFNDTGGTGTDFTLFLISGDEVGVFTRDGVTTRIAALATNTIYDWNDWIFVQTGTKTLAQAFADGFLIGARRLEPSGETDGDWCLRVYEITVTAVLANTVIRNYPRSDGLGWSSAGSFYPPSKADRHYGGWQ